MCGGLFGAVTVLILHMHTDSEEAKGSHCGEDNSFGHHLLWVASTEEVVLGVCSRCIVMGSPVAGLKLPFTARGWQLFDLP